MLPAEVLAALDGLPPREALRRPLVPGDTVGRRAARLLGGNSVGDEPMTVGDALFRWARVEPEGLADANVTELHQMSEMLGAVGRIPKRLSLAGEVRRSATSMVLASANDIGGYQALDVARQYDLQRSIAYLFDAQGCEASISGAEDDTALLLNGLMATVHDPSDRLPTKFDRLTFVAQDIFSKIGGVAVSSELLYPLSGMNADLLDGLMPTSDGLNEIWEICQYASAAAQSARLLLRRDADGLLKIANLGSSAVAGHLGHFVAGKVAALALVGLTGPWLIVLAPVAGFAGRVAAKNLYRRARYRLSCGQQITALKDAISNHCIASRDALETNIVTTKAQAGQFRGMHAEASGPAKECISDWLDRLQHIHDFRRLSADRLHRASTDLTVLSPLNDDIILAAQESLLNCARVGLHPANVATTAHVVVTASQALHKQMDKFCI